MHNSKETIIVITVFAERNARRTLWKAFPYSIPKFYFSRSFPSHWLVCTQFRSRKSFEHPSVR